MRVLIVETDAELAVIWAGHLLRRGARVRVAHSQSEAIAELEAEPAEVIILDLLLRDGSALAVADYVSFRHPEARIVPVTRDSFFSDGSVFQHISNACSVVESQTPPEDLAAIVEHYATAR